MTFLSISDTAKLGRTCHSWLHVAYYRSPKKDDATFELRVEAANDPLNHVKMMLQSPFKRHFTRATVSITNTAIIPDDNELLVMLCNGMKEVKELLIQNLDSSGSRPFDWILEWSLKPLLRHESTLTRIVLKCLTIRESNLLVIAQLSHLETFQYSIARSPDVPADHCPHHWSSAELRALCRPNNRLAELRNFVICLVWPFSMEHVECLKNLPVQALSSLDACGGIKTDSLKEIGHFKFLKKLTIPLASDWGGDTITPELLGEAFQQAPWIDSLELQYFRFKLGDIKHILQPLTQLTQLGLRHGQFDSTACLSELKPHRISCLTFDDVPFTSPESLTDLPPQITLISFFYCPTIRFDHLRQLCTLPLLTYLILLGHFHDPLTPDEIAQCQPPSTILPSLTDFRLFSH